MDFAHPERLWLLGFLPIGLWITRRLTRVRRKDAESLGCLVPPNRAPALGIASIALILTAAAGPRIVNGRGSPLPAGRDVVIVIDVSRSMGVEDAFPNRLGAAVIAAESAIKSLGKHEGDRVAVLAFSGAAVARCGLTTNLGAAANVLRRLRVGELKPVGSSLESALRAAAEMFDDRDRSEGRELVVFTDGEDNVGFDPAILDDLRAAGIVVHAVTVGDAVTARPVPDSIPGSFVKYREQTVLSRRRDDVPARISSKTGGVFVPLGLSQADLGGLFDSRRGGSRRTNDLGIEHWEISAWFAIGSIAVLILPSRAFSRGKAVLVPLSLLSVGASGDEPAAVLVARGLAAHDRSRFDEALRHFAAAERAEPGSAIPKYNMASSLFRLGDYGGAALKYEEALKSAEPLLSVKIAFGLGNSLLASRSLREAIQAYDDCLEMPASGSVAEAVRDDARINRDYARSLLREEDPDLDPDQARPKVDPPDEDARSRPPKAPDDPSKNGSTATPSGSGSASRAGGAGGTSDSPASNLTPEQRLARAADAIRRSLAGRLEEEPVGRSNPEELDW